MSARVAPRVSLKPLAALLLVLPQLAGCGSGPNHPADQVLLDNFRTNRADFERLLRMFLADGELRRVAPDFTRPEDPRSVGVSRERIEEYRGLFERLGLSAGVEGYEEKDYVLFHASTRRPAVTGSSKGYVQTARPPERVLDGLDDPRSPDGRSLVAHRHIEGNRYLYFDYED